jgi:YidC/Oxa1 family membrane protein insertase
MDKKSTIGLVIIGVILATWVFMSGPTDAQKAEAKRKADSTLSATKKQVAEQQAAELKKQAAADSAAKLVVATDTSKKALAVTDSVKNILKQKAWRDFLPASEGTDKCITLENEKIKVLICSKGGSVASVTLKEYTRSDRKTPVELFEKESSKQKVILNIYGADNISLDSLYFTPDKEGIKVSGTDSQSVKFKLPLAKPGSYLEYVYTLKGNDYMLGYKINLVNTGEIMTAGAPIIIDWTMKFPTQEMHIEKERAVSTIFYQNSTEETESLTGAKQGDTVSVTDAEMKWIALKQQFFTSALISSETFGTGTNLALHNYGRDEKVKTPDDNKYVKNTRVKVELKNPEGKVSHSLQYYFGPNHYKILKQYDLGLEEMIPMGWNFFSYINKWIIVPIFSLFEGSGLSFGWVILILTFIIKALLFPIGYMTYKSSAKMKVLKPETDAITERFGKDGDQMKKQQETMALYRKAGVSPFSGCLPLVFQMFVLIALFNFFPAAIELRQKSFWWAPDLSTYDSVWDFGFKVPFYGDHMSMFALMMFISTLAFTFYQQKMFPNQQASMPGMKFMMYAMPFIFLGFMNDYSAGLSWYYFVANVINIGQNLVLRKFIDDKKLRAEVDANMKKPQKKKGGWAAKLEQAAKERQKQLKR